MLLLILHRIFDLFAKQGLPLRGDRDESDISQLLCLRGVDHQGIDAWLGKKTNNTSPDIQNELMALHIPPEISHNIVEATVSASWQTNALTV